MSGVGVSAAGTRTLARRTIGDILDDARARLDRLTPPEAWATIERGALLIVIRPAAQRAAEGQVPAALVIERNVLEWRLDPASAHRIPEAVGYDVQPVILCSEGYTSGLAAAALLDLGLHRAIDVVGGFHGWRAAGLPTTGGVAGARELVAAGAIAHERAG